MVQISRGGLANQCDITQKEYCIQRTTKKPAVMKRTSLQAERTRGWPQPAAHAALWRARLGRSCT